jgi:hypothetical protein
MRRDRPCGEAEVNMEEIGSQGKRKIGPGFKQEEHLESSEEKRIE